MTRPDPTPADLADAALVYSHEHAGMGGADAVEIRRHGSGDYIHRSWGVDPDHGDYDRVRWVPAAEGQALIERVRAEDEARYPGLAPATGKDLPAMAGMVLLALAVVALAAVFLGRIVIRALEASQ